MDRAKAETQVVIWAGLRLALGLLQMALSVAGIRSLFVLGLHPITYFLVGTATAVTVTSRILFRRKRQHARDFARYR